MSFSAAGRNPIPPIAKLEGNFLESILPVRAFAHLTTQRRIAEYRLEGLFSAWIQDMQAHNRVTLGWVKSIENDPWRHVHAALIAASPLDCVHAAAVWQTLVAPRYSEGAIVEPYRDGLCGLGYVLKRLGSSREEPQFSENIAAFARVGGNSRFPVNSAQRRQRRRITAQFEQAGRYAKR